MVQEKLVKTHLKILVKNNAQTPKFIGSEKLAVGGLSGLSVDRPVDRPTVIFQTVVPSVDRPVDRGKDTESKLSVRSAARPPGRPGPFQRAELSGRSTGSVGRPSCRTGVHVCARRSTGSVDRLKPGQV